MLGSFHDPSQLEVISRRFKIIGKSEKNISGVYISRLKFI